MEKKTPLLAESLRNCLITLRDTYSSKIASDLLEADILIESYNKLCGSMYYLSEFEQIKISELFESRIAEFINDSVRALSIRKDVFEIAFTPKGKTLKYSSNGVWSREDRQTGKPARIIKKLLAHEYKERDIELFNNQLKSEIMCLGEFQIVEGEDICKWYHIDNYYAVEGTLGNSCMKHEECQDYFDVYKDLAKMLICTKDNKLLGRALIWEIDGDTYMDRVYVCTDYLEEAFYQHAISNKWIVRENNSLLRDLDNQFWLTPEDSYKSDRLLDLCIKCPECYDKFPYMDSFRYFNPDDCTLSSIHRPGCICLSCTDGFWRNFTDYVCPRCGNVVRVSDDDDHPWNWSEYHDEYICEDCSEYNDFLDDYIIYDTPVFNVVSFDQTYDVPKDIVREEFTEENVFHASANFVKINDVYYTMDCVRWSEEDNKYKVVND